MFAIVFLSSNSLNNLRAVKKNHAPVKTLEILNTFLASSFKFCYQLSNCFFCFFSGYNNQDPYHRLSEKVESWNSNSVFFFLLFSIVVEFGHSVISSATPTTSVPGCSTYYAVCSSCWCPALSKSIVPQLILKGPGISKSYTVHSMYYSRVHLS